MSNVYPYLIILGVSFLTSLVLTRCMISLGPRLGMIDMPDERRIHKKPIPRAGGVAVFLAFNIGAMAFYGFLMPPDFYGQLDAPWWFSFLAASLILCAVGVVDDTVGMSPLLKLLGQIAASCVLFFLSDKGVDHAFGVKFPLIPNLILTVIWCVALINAFNLIDGLDGLCGGLAVISSLGICATYVLRGQSADAIVVVALIGAVLGFLRYNFHPARIFLGDTGSMFLGLALASLALQSAGKSTVLVSIGIPLLAAGVPIMDTVLAVWRRSARRLTAKLGGGGVGAKIMGADKEHLHHRLLEAGFSQGKVALILYAGNLMLVTLGLFSIFMSKELVGLFLIVFIAGVYVVIRHVVHVEIWDTGRLVAEGIKRPGRALLGMVIYPVWDLAWMSLALVGAIILEIPQTANYSLGQWARLLPVWIAPVFLLLVLGNTYARVWSRSNFRDYLILFCALNIGVLLTFAFHSAAEADLRTSNLRICLLFAYFSMFGIFGIRVVLQTLREWMIAASVNEKSKSRYVVKHILLYGAGNRGSLFLRELRLMHPDQMATLKIIGFLDDDLSLRRRYVHGVQVLGPLDELDDLITEFDVDQVIVTSALLEANERKLKMIAASRGITLSQWGTVSEEIDLHPQSKTPLEPPRTTSPKF